MVARFFHLGKRADVKFLRNKVEGRVRTFEPPYNQCSMAPCLSRKDQPGKEVLLTGKVIIGQKGGSSHGSLSDIKTVISNSS